MARVVGDLERLLSAKLDELKSRPIPPEMPAEGGGATTFAAEAAARPLRMPRGAPPGFAATDGGGGTIFAASGTELALR